MMTTLKAMAIVALWNSGRFNTLEIAHCIGVPEADVCRVVHFAREERRARS